MKKLTTLLFALLFTAGMAFGQNNATTEQDGSNNSSTIDQTYQAGASRAQNNAKVDQTGDDNKVLKLDQVGAGNTFYVTQTGDNNMVSSHPDQGDANNSQYASFDGVIKITQINDGNKVWDADQAGSNNALYIDQHGGDIANVEAQASPKAGNGNYIDIDQSGGSNVVGGYSDDAPGAYQEGENNRMTVSQSGGASAGATDYLPDPYPNGAGFLGFNDDFFRGNIEGGQGLIQRGDDNVMTITQGSGGSNIVTYAAQRGKRNDITVTQADGGANQVNALQVGDDEISHFDQGIGTNAATSLQRGPGNESYVIQGDGTNGANIMQNGTDLVSHVTQSGGTNNATVEQHGTGNHSTITQN